MIVAMKKVCVVTQGKDTLPAVSRLRSLGLLHVEHTQEPKGTDIAALEEDLVALNSAINILLAIKSSKISCPPKIKELSDWKITVKHIIDLDKRLDQLNEYSRAMRLKIEEWAQWGDFEPEAIADLMQKNIFVKFFRVPERQIRNLPEGVIVKKISAAGGVANILVITRDKDVRIPFKEITPPKLSLGKMQARIKEDALVIESIQEELRRQACYCEELILVRARQERELEFFQAVRGMSSQGALTYISGYVPQDKLETLAQEAEVSKWGLLITEPKVDDSVPTLLRNPKWVEVITPVFKLLEILPGYRELDISPLLLIFLSLFFGMIIGDAGYGAVYILFTFFMQKKFGTRFRDKRLFFLLYTFSSCAVLWGLLTGTVFGQEWYLKAGFKAIVPVLNDTKALQAFCFLIGAFHLTLAHLWQGIRKLPSLVALSDAGWICVLWAAFFLAKNLILDVPLPFFEKWLIIIGIGLVVFFTSPQKNILRGVGKGLGTVALSLVNNFTDVVSYIRLFAIGLAGVAISDTVNALAQGVGPGNLATQVIIVFIGHTINILLGPLSVLVHGIRLNVLEFSSHANLSWSGVAYKPLRE